VQELEEEVLTADGARKKMKATCDGMQEKNVNLQLQFQLEKTTLTKALAAAEKKISGAEASTTDLTDQISALNQKISKTSDLQADHDHLISERSDLKEMYLCLLTHYTNIIKKASQFEFSLQKLLSEYHDTSQVKVTKEKIKVQLLQSELDYFLE
jgi:uncharacterized protein involved in exopolysaccharide biosynthesis